MTSSWLRSEEFGVIKAFGLERLWYMHDQGRSKQQQPLKRIPLPKNLSTKASLSATDKWCIQKPIFYCQRSWNLIHTMHRWVCSSLVFVLLKHFDCVSYLHGTITILKKRNVAPLEKTIGTILCTSLNLQWPYHFPLSPR